MNVIVHIVAYSFGPLYIILWGFFRDRHELLESIHDTISRLVTSDETNAFVEQKMRERTDEWYQKLEVHRAEELSKMRECFRSEEYKTARQAFVYH